MDLATGVGLPGGGDSGATFDEHAVIVIVGGSIMATVIREAREGMTCPMRCARVEVGLRHGKPQM